MRGDVVSELRLAAMYGNQVARAIVQMDDRLSNFFFNAMQSTHNTFAIDRSIAIDVLGIPAVGRVPVLAHHQLCLLLIRCLPNVDTELCSLC